MSEILDQELLEQSRRVASPIYGSPALQRALRMDTLRVSNVVPVEASGEPTVNPTYRLAGNTFAALNQVRFRHSPARRG